MSLDKCVALIFSLLILGQAFLLRKVVGTWVFPACIFSLLWFGFTFFPLLLMFFVPIEPLSIAFIFACTCAFSLSALFFNWNVAFRQNQLKQETAHTIYGNAFLRTTFYVCSLLSLVFALLNVMAQGISARDLAFDMLAASSRYVQLRYDEELVANIYGQLGVVLTYVGVSIGGFLVGSEKPGGRRWGLIALSFLPSLFVMVSQSAKGILFLSLALFYGAVLITKVASGDFTILSRRAIKLVLAIGIPVFPLVVISFLSRGLQDSDLDLIAERLAGYVNSYLFAHLYAFSDWFSSTIGKASEIRYAHEGSSYGFYTFMAVFRLLGSNRYVPQGVYDDYFSYGDRLTSNIFTMYRGLIIDYGLIGSVIFMFLTGLVCHLCFYFMLKARKPAFTVVAFVLMIGYFAHSYLASVFMYNSPYAVFGLLWIVLLCNKFMLRRSTPHAGGQTRPVNHLSGVLSKPLSGVQEA
jgi:oligosaccharide repeat unit polymerase